MAYTAIVGYAYRADTYCTKSECLPLATGEGQPFDGWKLGDGIYMTTENNLDEIAAAFGIDRNDETSFDSDYFPKVILSTMTDDTDHCATCGDKL